MLAEINAAAGFIVNILARQPRHDELTQDHIENFAASLVANMHESFAPSWQPEAPLRGSANRCIRINFGVIDKVILDAAVHAGIQHFVSKLLPSELTMWVDPHEVSYKLNDRSPMFTIFENKPVSPQQQLPSQQVQFSNTQQWMSPTSPVMHGYYQNYAGMKVPRATIPVM